jgi:hypothetical protein
VVSTPHRVESLIGWRHHRDHVADEVLEVFSSLGCWRNVMTDARQTGPLRLRLVLSSPGEVVDERNLARGLLKHELPSDPLLGRHIEFDVVSWDDPASPTPMPATLTPQEAVNRFGPKPSECDVVVVILWSRLGTPLDVTAFHKEPGGEPD